MRKENFDNLIKHPWFSKLYVKLTEKELVFCRNFLDNHETLDNGNFEMAINRLFLEKDKPKNWKVICELLMVSKTI